MMDEIRDPMAASVTLLASSSSLTVDDDDDDDVELNCIAVGELGSPLTRQRAAMIQVKARLYVTMVLNKKKKKLQRKMDVH